MIGLSELWGCGFGCEDLAAGNYMFKANNKETRDVVLVSLLLTLNIVTPCSSVSIVNFEKVNADWANTLTFLSPNVKTYLRNIFKMQIWTQTENHN